MARRDKRLLLICLMALFALAGAARLNPFCLLEPDSPDYLFTSRSLALFEGYREIDFPGEPLHAFRPPGLAVLLVPLSWISPYDVPLAKALVLFSALLALALLWSYAQRIGGTSSALAAAVVVATSPFSLLFATEVMSEFPYLACTFAILLLMGSAEAGRGWRRAAVVALLLATLPFIRTIGVVWIAAIGVWGLFRRSTWRWSLTAALAVVPTALWSWRNGRTGGVTYLAAIVHDISGAEPSEVAMRLGAGVWYYIREFFGLLLPAVDPGSPLYDRVLLSPAPDLAGLFGLSALPAALFALLFLLGLWARRREEGGLIALHTLLLFAALALYPPRHERLVWPLLPLAWIYAIAGARFVGRRLARSLRPVRWAAFAAVALLSIWQGVACAEMVSTNLSWLRLGERFYSDMAPPMYYADWQSAGRWIASSAPPEARILTRHSDVGFTARRYQDSLRFEELSPTIWRRAISQFHARFAVVPTTLCGRMFPFHLLDEDPVYRYDTVYEAGDVAVLELLPNRSGTIRLESSWLPGALEKCGRLSDLHPERVDLARRVAELQARAGRYAEAERRLRNMIASGTEEAGLHLSLGVVLEKQDRYREAMEELTLAKSMPRAALLERTIDNAMGRVRAEASLRAMGQTADSLVDSARGWMRILEYGRAREAADRALEMAPAEPAVLKLDADLQAAVGRKAEARLAYSAAAAAGDRDAMARLELMDAERLRTSGSTAGEKLLLRLAVREAGYGRPGRALVLMERAGRDYPASREVKRRLADLYFFYGLVERSAALYRELLEEAPSDEGARRGLRQSLEAAALPSF